ncbi:N(6)-adenine-specific methyltransferase METTL4 [Stigmatopora nigra]
MSVVVENTHGWFLDACSLIDQGYVSCFRRRGESRSEKVGRFKRQYFRILKRYGNASKSNDPDHKNQDAEKPQKVTFQKRKQIELNHGEKDSIEFHEKIRCVILEGTKSLVESAKCVGYLQGDLDGVDDIPPCHECNLATLCDMAKELPLVEDDNQESSIQFLEDNNVSHLDLFSYVTENPSEQAKLTILMGDEYIIPPHAGFLLSDFSRMRPLLHCGRKFDVIVLDPPWENKSVKRSRRYNSLPSSQLKRLPVPQLASADCLVVTWVTNRPSHLRFVRDELYPQWGVEPVAQWFWVKVSTDGNFVFPLDSPHKKPYEVMVLGRFRSEFQTSSSEMPVVEVPPVPDQRLIVSVPSALHSHKPPLAEVLKPYTKEDPKCLELFARSLQPGWTSWGNEVLRFQHNSYFTLTPASH